MQLIIFIDKEESKSLSQLCWPLGVLVTALSLDSALQISNSWEYSLNIVHLISNMCLLLLLCLALCDALCMHYFSFSTSPVTKYH